MSDVSGYLILSAKSSYRNIMCELVPGSPPQFLFFVRARGEPGNKATTTHPSSTGGLAGVWELDLAKVACTQRQRLKCEA